jgi:hypothetical protein
MLADPGADERPPRLGFPLLEAHLFAGAEVLLDFGVG